LVVRILSPATNQVSGSGYVTEWAEGPEALVTTFENMAGPISEAYADRLRTADLQTWLAAAEDRVSIEDALETVTMPSYLYAGDADPLFAQAKLASERITSEQFFCPAGAYAHLDFHREPQRFAEGS
jgi:hypothetical protein